MPTPVKLALQATGVREVKADLKSVKEAYVEMEKASVAASEAASKKRRALIKEESKAKIAAIKEESAARKDAMRSEKDFKRSLGGKGSRGGDDGIASLLKNAGVAGAAFAAVTSAVNFASGALQQFGSFVINDVVKPAWALQTRAQQVANNSGGALTQRGIMDRAKAIGLSNNMDPTKVIEATGAFQDLTGEAKLGFEIMPLLATLSKGRGDSDPKELAELAAAFYKPGMKAEDLNQIMLAMAGQGEKGSITVGQLAKLSGRISAPAEKMGGDALTKLTTASALLQTSRKGFGTVDETAEGLKSFMTDSFTVGKRFSAKSFGQVGGVDTLLDPVKFIGDIYRKTGGNALKTQGFSEPATKFLESYRGIYSDAFKEAKGGGKSDTEARESGAQAIEEFINSMKRSTSTMDAESAKRDAVMATDGERVAQTFAKIKDSIETQALPIAKKFADWFEDNADGIKDGADVLIGTFGALVDVIEFLLEPITSLGSMINKLTKNTGEGDVLETITASQLKRKGNQLPAVTDWSGAAERGAWVADKKGGYKFIKGPADENVDISQWMADRGMVPMAGGDPSQRWGKQGVFEEKKFSPEAIARANTSGYGMTSEPLVTEMEPYLPVDTSVATPSYGPVADDGEGAATSESAAEAQKKLSENATAAADAVGQLTKQVDALATQMDGLSRNASFLDKR